ncbi:MAG: M48 family metallopeptidase [Gemmatimonadaceae bacterium]
MTGEPVNLFAQQEKNRRRSRWLVIVFVLFFAWLGFGGDWIYWELTRTAEPGGYRHVVPWFGLAMSVVAALFAVWATRTGAKRVLWSTGATEVTTPATAADRQLVNVVEEMAIAAGLPRPRIYVIPDPDPNALAAGLDPATSHIAVTQGLLAICSRDELQAVIGHEMAHIRNFDTRLLTLLAGLVGAVALVSDGLGRVLRGGLRVSGGGSGSRGGGKKGGVGPLVLVIIALWIISWVLAPLIVRLLALGVSRQREYLADATSAQLTRNPIALATALEKIEHAHAPTASIKKGTAHLCIADPLGRRVSAREGRLADFLGTHPPMAIRVARLKAMGYQDQKRAGTFAPVS